MAFSGGCMSRVILGRGLKFLLSILALVFIVSCSGSKDSFPVYFPTVPDSTISVSISDLEFSDVSLNTPKTISITISNTGNVQATGIEIGALSGEFSRTTTCGTTLDAGTSCVVRVTLTPTTEGDKTTTLTISSANGGSVTVKLTGKGSVNPTVNLSVDITALAFYDVLLNTPVAKSITISNTGNVQATGIEIGALSGEFSRATTCGTTLDAGTSCDVVVTYTPTTVGNKTAILTISLANGSGATINITGKGSATPTTNLSVDITALAFYDVLLNTPVAKSITISNAGNVQATGIEIGALSGEFSRTTTCGTTLEAGTSCDVVVTYTPTTVGDKTATLTISLVNGRGVNINITGKGSINPTVSLSIDNAMLTFGTVPLYSTKALSVKVTNTGNSQATSVVIGALSGEFSRTTTCGTTLDAGTSCDVVVVFAPTTNNDKSATLAITSANGGNKNISMTGSVGLPSGIFVGSIHTFGYKADGQLYSWGANLHGQLGLGDNVDKNSPTAVPLQSPTAFTRIYAANEYSLAAGNDGKFYAWGKNSAGQLGIASTDDAIVPTVVTFPNGVTSFTDVYTAAENVLAIGNDGKLYAWGMNSAGQLGVGDKNNKTSPTAVTLPSGVAFFTDVHFSGENAFAKGNNNKLYAWGKNDYGQLGVGGTADVLVPTEVIVLNGVAVFTDIISNADFTHAKDVDGNLYAWGLNDLGQLGIGNQTTPVQTPTLVTPPTGVRFKEVHSGLNYVLAKGNDNNLYAWGSNEFCRLGVGSACERNMVKTVPTKVISTTGVTFSDINAQTTHTIAKGSDGNWYAWGNNAFGSLGVGNYTNRNIPTQIQYPPTVRSFTEMHSVAESTFVKGDDGKYYAWGRNTYGQLGVGDNENKHTPILVLLD